MTYFKKERKKKSEQVRNQEEATPLLTQLSLSPHVQRLTVMILTIHMIICNFITHSFLFMNSYNFSVKTQGRNYLRNS